MNKFIPVSRPNINKADQDYVNKYSLKKIKIANSNLVTQFEKKISILCNRKYAIAVNSGTTALHAALASLNLKKGSKVLIPDFSIISVLNAVLNNNLIPVFAEVDINTFNIEYESIKKKLTNHNIKAAIIVSTYNSAPEFDKIIKLFKKNNIKLIEDAAESFGGTYINKPFGSLGDLSILSFYSNKLITTGEGGMILTNNTKYYNFIKNYKNLFFNSKRNFIHKNIGNNFRISSIQASLGLSQLNRINKFINIRKKFYDLYIKKLDKKYINFQKINKKINKNRLIIYYT